MRIVCRSHRLSFASLTLENGNRTVTEFNVSDDLKFANFVLVDENVAVTDGASSDEPNK